jgi:hypothetical protein
MALQQLFESLSQRKRPEDVAEMILSLLGDNLSAKEKGKLGRVARGSLKRSFWGYTSMSQQFKMPVGAEKKIDKAVEIFKLARSPRILITIQLASPALLPQPLI